MRAFSLISILVTALLIAWLSASGMLSMTGGSRLVTPLSDQSTQMQRSPIDRADELVSMDRARQQRMEELMR